MEKMSAQPQRSPSTVPLARDADGNFIELSDGAVGWRIRRQTGGRPRLVLDSRKQPMLFPLDYTISDVEDVLTPGSYLLDAVDKSGEPLGVTIAVSIGMPRNAESVEADKDEVESSPLVVPTTLPNTTNEVRLVLEANVRATQMAFIHNQRTLETGLRMAETLRDSVQVLASSQADWIKSISAARGFFRNTGQAMAPVEVKHLTVKTGGGNDEDDDEDDDDGDQYADDGRDDSDGGGGGGGDGGKPHWSEQFMPIISQVAMQVMPAINAWSARQMMGARDSRAGEATGNAVDSRGAAAQAGQQAAQAEDERAAQAEREHAEKLTAAIAAASSPGPGVNVIKLLQLLPQRTATKLMQIQMALSREEQADAMQILRGYGADTLEEVLSVFDMASLDECTTFLRNLIAEWHRLNAARRERANAARSDDAPHGASGTGASGTGSVGATSGGRGSGEGDGSTGSR
jgi:hypothetical protein